MKLKKLKAQTVESFLEAFPDVEKVDADEIFSIKLKGIKHEELTEKYICLHKNSE